MRFLPAALLLTSLLAGQAQVQVELVLDQDQVLPNETFKVGVRITNFSGRTLKLGDDNQWARFSVESHNGFIVSRLAEPDVSGVFEIRPSEVATRRVDIAACFNFSQPGRYSVSATVDVKELNLQLRAKPVSFGIVSGTRLWEQTVGLPGRRTADGQAETRKFTVLQANRVKQITLYVRVAGETDGRVRCVRPLGPLVSFGQPECQVDAASQLHVLHQTGARAFNYCVVNPEGEIVLRHTYEYANSRPALRPDQDGKIRVLGGMRRRQSTDIPPPPPPTDDSTGPLPNPIPATPAPEEPAKPKS